MLRDSPRTRKLDAMGGLDPVSDDLLVRPRRMPGLNTIELNRADSLTQIGGDFDTTFRTQPRKRRYLLAPGDDRRIMRYGHRVPSLQPNADGTTAGITWLRSHGQTRAQGLRLAPARQSDQPPALVQEQDEFNVT